ncbi:MAG: glycosyltransferase [Flavobacteriales bacterium]
MNSNTNLLNPLVSVIVTVYNHEQFIKRCLDSILSQITSFEFEILVGVDESTDNSLAICKRIEAKFDNVKVIANDRGNILLINGLRVGRMNFVNSIKHAQAKYIARCDGDDFWTNPDKLQKQVDFLEKNPQYSMCFTNFNIVDGKNDVINENGWDGKKTENIDHIEVLSRYSPLPSATLYRREYLPQKFPTQFFRVYGGDYFLHALITKHGQCHFINEVMASYRIHSGGIWSLKSDEEKYNRQMHTYKVSWTYFTEKEEREAIRMAIRRPFKNLFWIYTQDGKVQFLKKNFSLFWIALKYGLLKEWWQLNKKLLKK